MKVVLDTNIIVSAFLSPEGKPSTILQLVLRGDIEIYFNTAILVEYEQVLIRSKFAGKIHQPAIQRFFELINGFGINIIATHSQINLTDEPDRKFYDVAQTAGAFLITGNKKHYPDESFVVNATEFLAALKD
jgi:putative PIN family toxin of toxin-antitoxin system